MWVQVGSKMAKKVFFIPQSPFADPVLSENEVLNNHSVLKDELTDLHKILQKFIFPETNR